MTSWSYSSYSTAVKCLQLYKYLYIDKLVPEGPESGDLLFGTALHAALNASITGKDAQKVFEGYWFSYQDSDVDYGRFGWKDLANLGSEFLRKFDKKYSKDFKPLQTEKRIYASYGDVKLEGTPDFVGMYQDKYSLIDFKTSGYNYLPEMKECALQLYLYAYLVKENYGKYPDQLGYFVFSKGSGSIQAPMLWDFKEHKMKLSLDQMTKWCETMDTYAIKESKFMRNYGACVRGPLVCPFFDKCHGENK